MNLWKMALASFVLLVSVNVCSASVYYTFEGYIDNFGNDISGEAASVGLGYLNPVKYVVELDFAGTATRTLTDGSVEYLSDKTGNYYGWYETDYFYSALRESSHTLLSEYMPQDLSKDYIDYNTGSSTTTSYTYTIGGESFVGYSHTGNITLADILTIQSQHKHVQDWLVGDTLQGLYSYGDESQNMDNTFSTSLTLTNIAVATVPSPPSILLLGSGLIGLVGVSRIKQK